MFAYYKIPESTVRPKRKKVVSGAQKQAQLCAGSKAKAGIEVSCSEEEMEEDEEGMLQRQRSDEEENVRLPGQHKADEEEEDLDIGAEVMITTV